MALRTGYGTGLYSASKYGLPEVYEGAVSDSVAATAAAAGQRIALAASAIESAVSHVVAGVRVQNGIVADNASAAATAAGYTTVVGAVSDTSTLAVALYWNRVRPFAAADTSTVGASVNSRYKWVDISPPTTTWTASDYREGAA